MIILQVTFIILNWTIDIWGFDTWKDCNTVLTALERGHPVEKGHAQRFECVVR